MGKRRESTRPLLPEPIDGIQVNICRNTLCAQFGAHPKVVARSAHTDRIEGFARSGGVGLRGVRCVTCGSTFLLKSNRGVVEELARAKAFLAPPEVSCSNGECPSHASTAEPARFHRFGQTKRGSARVRCTSCGKTQSFASNPVWRQKASDKNVQVLKVLINKAPIRRLLETTEVSAQTVYRKLEFFEMQCLGFAAERERALAERSFDHIDLATDRQDYLINWGRHLNRRSFALRVLATAEARSGYVFGVHPNFDGSLGTVEIERQARDCGDIALEPYERKYSRLWLLSDYTAAAKANEARSVRAGRDRSQNQPAQSALRDPFAEDYNMTHHKYRKIKSFSD